MIKIMQTFCIIDKTIAYEVVPWFVLHVVWYEYDTNCNASGKFLNAKLTVTQESKKVWCKY